MSQVNETLSPATLAALGKFLAKAAKDNREALEPGTHKVSETVTLALAATVKVGEDYEQRIVGKAKPWDLLVALRIEANERIATLAKLAGKDPEEFLLTLESAVKLAESVDADMVKQAQEDANKEVAASKAPTLTPCKGKVTIKGAVETPDDGEPEAA
jgi:hypothetical protein